MAQFKFPLTADDTAPLRELLVTAGSAPNLRVAVFKTEAADGHMWTNDEQAGNEDLDSLAQLLASRPSGVRFALPDLRKADVTKLRQRIPTAVHFHDQDRRVPLATLRGVADRGRFDCTSEHDGPCAPKW